ncbi:MAG: acyl carrier protein [Planctomycetes bacterium]|nr:acyl carrier protein [Planctomycetota bacterium]
MQQDSLLETIQAMIAQVLVLEAREVLPTSRFFPDLHGESIDLLDLGFMVERQLGIRINFSEALAGDAVRTDESGRLTAESTQEIRRRFPFLDLSRLPSGATPKRLIEETLTVSAITEFVRRAPSGRQSQDAQCANTQNMQSDTEPSKARLPAR